MTAEIAASVAACSRVPIVPKEDRGRCEWSLMADFTDLPQSFGDSYYGNVISGRISALSYRSKLILNNLAIKIGYHEVQFCTMVRRYWLQRFLLCKLTFGLSFDCYFAVLSSL